MIKIESIFLMQRSSLFSTYDSVITAIAEHSSWNKPDFLQLQWFDSKNTDIEARYRADREYYQSVGVETIDYLEFDEGKRVYDYVFIQMPYLNMSGPWFQPEPLRQFAKRLVYIPYYLSDPTNDVYDNPFLCEFDVIFCHSYQEKNRLLSNAKLKEGSRVVVSGTPKIDYYYRKQQEVPAHIPGAMLDFKHKKTAEGKRIFLWTPHWFQSREEGKSSSSFLPYFKEIFRFFRGSTDSALVFRPHPLLFKCLLDAELIDKATETGLMDFLDQCDNIFYDSSNDARSSCEISDYLICDISGIMMEYIHTRKPIIYLWIDSRYNGERFVDPSIDPAFNDLTIIRSLYISRNSTDLFDIVSDLTNGNDPKYCDRLEAINYYFANKGRSGEFIADYLVNLNEPPSRQRA